MAKNKNRNRNYQQNNQVSKPTSTQKPTLTDEQELEIELQQEELQSVEAVEQLSPESENKLKESETREDLPRYWNYVKDINRRLESLIKLANDEKDKTSRIKEELEASKMETEELKADYKKKLEDVNKKDKELLERELAFNNGEYSTVIKGLLDTIKDTERKIFTDTENLFKELSDFHKNNLDELSKRISESTVLEKQQADLKRDRKKFEAEKQIFKDELQDEFESRYSDEINCKSSELERLQRKANILEQENTKFKQLFGDLHGAFGSTDPYEILKVQSILTEKVELLNKELNERPEKYELINKQAKIEELRAKVNDYESKINDKELLELKQILNNADSYVIEINALKNKIESSDVREESLKKTIADLKETINQLKGESKEKANAFEFAKKCDADTKDLGTNHLQSKNNSPKDLADLAGYVQKWMAFKSDKPFYYSLETIRLFLAGLHMSPISILQGISGTGKTSLPREFAKALISENPYIGIDDEKQNKAPYRICAVQSGWRDNMDLMGYYNSFEHKYKETDFFKALYTAGQPKYADTLFMIIMDEMNLSRPEHYFADFLSLLEQSPSERYIGLSNTPNDVLPDLIKGGKLKIPENVRFIGTANHDESTLEFAPKTYDRSNLMEMPKNLPDKKNFRQIDTSFNVKYSWLNKKFYEAEQKNKNSYNKFSNFINSDDMKILFMDKGIGIGNRLEIQAEKFISVYVESGQDKEMDDAKAADHLITSRLFRTLKNRYDVDKANMTKFKDDYVTLFSDYFKQQPEFAIDLCDTEIRKK